MVFTLNPATVRRTQYGGLRIDRFSVDIGNGPTGEVTSDKIDALFAALREHFPEKFDTPTAQPSPAADIRATITLEGLDAIREATREIAENMERATAAKARMEGR